MGDSRASGGGKHMGWKVGRKNKADGQGLVIVLRTARPGTDPEPSSVSNFFHIPCSSHVLYMVFSKRCMWSEARKKTQRNG